MTYRVTSEWMGLKRNRPFPSIDFLHPKTFSVAWDSCVLVRSLDEDFPPPPAGLEFEFIGKNFKKDAPGCSAGERLAAVPPQSLLSLSNRVVQRTFERSTAVIYNGIQSWGRSEAVYFRTIAVPFGNSEGELKYVLGAVSHKRATEQLPTEKPYDEFLEFREGSWLPLREEEAVRRFATA